MTYTTFMQMFPDNRTCLDYLRNKFFPDGSDCPKCGKATKFHAVKGRSAYACQYCRGQVYPTANTIFHKSSTSLQLWFWSIYLMSSTRCGISAKQLEREIGVSYPTAHRMFKQIRSLLSDEDGPLSGDVEIDETGVGGKPRAGQIKSRSDARKWADQKTTVFGMVERGGRVRARVVPDRGASTLREVHSHVLPESIIFSDEWRTYRNLGKTYKAHKRIRHRAKIYVRGNVHTNTIEGFFGLLKNGIRGVYHAVSSDYLQEYCNEYAWRYNHRKDERPMFWSILDLVKKVPVAE